MSKNKPKETIEFVIRLQDKERKLIEDSITAYRFEKIGGPIMKMLSDPEGIAVLLGLGAVLVGFYWSYNSDPTSPDDIQDMLATWLEQKEQAGINLGFNPADPLGIPFFLPTGPLGLAWSLFDVLGKVTKSD